MSNFMKLDVNDFTKGFIVAVISAALGAIQPAVAAGTILDIAVLKGAGMTAIAAGIAYLMKNLATNSQGKIGTETPKP